MCVQPLFSVNKTAWPYINLRLELSNSFRLPWAPWEGCSWLAWGEQLVEQSELAALCWEPGKCRAWAAGTAAAQVNWKAEQGENKKKKKQNLTAEVAESGAPWKGVGRVAVLVDGEDEERQPVKWMNQGRMVSGKAMKVRPKAISLRTKSPAGAMCNDLSHLSSQPLPACHLGASWARGGIFVKRALHFSPVNLSLL